MKSKVAKDIILIFLFAFVRAVEIISNKYDVSLDIEKELKKLKNI